MKKILFTGFEPFGRDTVNPSWEAVSLLPESVAAGQVQLCRALMPVEYDRMRPMLSTLLERERPDAVLCVGQAEGRVALTMEYVAINLKDASIPDNAGVLCSGEPVLVGGPAAYFATLPVKRIAAAIRKAGVPSGVSYTAGTYVCNCLMYQLLSLAEERYPAMLGGFLHLPCCCAQLLDAPASRPSLPLDFMSQGLLAAAEEIARCLLTDSADISEATGYTH